MSTSMAPPRKINDYIYELCNPGTRPCVEMVFFHGLHLEDSSSKDTHIITWLSRDKPEFWLNWLLECIPDARILIVSYDAFPGKKEGPDSFCESLVHSFSGNQTKVGQKGCPVVLVGHSFGSLVIKELIVEAYSVVRLSRNHQDEGTKTVHVEKLLRNVRGIFTYASPYGSTLVTLNELQEELLTMFEEDIIDARRNEDFRMLRAMYGWKTFEVGETLPIFVKQEGLKGVLVLKMPASPLPEFEVDRYHCVCDDHFSVCQPLSRTSKGFQLLLHFVGEILEEVLMSPLINMAKMLIMLIQALDKVFKLGIYLIAS